MKRVLLKNTGFALVQGFAIGTIHKVIPTKKKENPQKIDKNQIEKELKKFEKSIAKANQEIDKTLLRLDKNKKNEDFHKIVKVHKSILNDPEIKKDIVNFIQLKLHSMESAINKKFLEIEKKFTSIQNPYLKERVSDYNYVKNSLISNCNKVTKKKITEPTILVLEDLSPSQVIDCHKNKNIVGICLEHGSRTSHTSIILKSLNMPSIIEIKENYHKLKEEEKVILDTNDSTLIINPNDKDIKICSEKISKKKKDELKLRRLINKPSLTKNGKKIKIRANIDFPEEIEIAKNNGAEGIGLLRTEMFYLEKHSLPSRIEQFNYYKKVASSFTKSVTIRTLDFGGDKNFGVLDIKKEENPNLGLRGIRFSLKNRKIFETQLEAILMASAYGKIKILLPMVSKIQEVTSTKEILARCKKKLQKENLPYDKNIKLGIMVEVPSVVFQMQSFAKICDFFSIGTNDLTQYIMGIDRNNSSIEEYYDENDPSIISAIKMILKTAKKENMPASLCGEIASDPEKIDKFLDLGIDELSVNVSSILTIKKKVVNYK